jgi:pimeloyl-ACP methyl ester carboxylesterase
MTHVERKYNRSRFLRTTGMALIASDLAMIGSAKADVSKIGVSSASPVKSGTITFGSLRQIDAGALSIGYVEAGPVDGPVVICLHGWPYDVNAYGEVTPILTAAGYRVIVPYLRGFGPTRFLSPETFRDGEQLAFALDTVALMDALKIRKAILAGYDYGGRAADIVAALWPERCKALVSGQGYLIVNYKANERPLPPQDELGLWFQYYFATERGQRGYTENLHDFNNLMWHWLSPKWNFDDATFERTAPSFDNPDHVAIVIHNFRTRYELASGDPKYDALNAKLQAYPVIAVPTITIATDFDGANASGASYRKQFSGKYAHRILTGYGHNVPQEDPKGFAQAVIDVDRFS